MVFGLSLAVLSFGNILNQAANAQVFAYVLPFLLVFALVYAILNKTQILGDNRGAIVIISVALGLLSLVGDYFPSFIQVMSPKLAIGLSILLAVLILLGLFQSDPDTKWVKYIFVGVGILAFVFIAYSSLSDYNYTGSFLWDYYGPSIITLIIIAVIIGFVVKKNK